MQTVKSRLHPLITIAAIAITLLSAMGIAAMTGMIPASKSQENAFELPKDVVKPIEPAISHPPARKTTARKAAPRPMEPVTYSDFNESPRVAQAAPAVEPVKPQLPAGQLGVVESVREVTQPGEAKGLGAIGGGVVGGVLGNKLGKGKGLVTILGAAGGAFAGHQIEKHARADKRWEIGVRLDDGSLRTLTSESQPAWRSGDRVRLVNDTLQAA
jgi:outer membrane lipoprotein SlyB